MATASPRKVAKYGWAHQALRDQVGRVVAAGRASCTRCGLPIAPGTAWELDHLDEGDGYAGPAHPDCNARAGAVKGHRLAAERNVPAATPWPSDALPDEPVQDAAGRWWSPADERGVRRRWSRGWYDASEVEEAARSLRR